MDRFRALVAAVELVSAQGHDLDAVLDALAEQARRLLGAAAATVFLAGPNERLTVRRPNPFAEPGTPLSVAGGTVGIGPFTRVSTVAAEAGDLDGLLRFQRIARFQSVATPVGTALDLAAATTPPVPSQPP